MLTKIEVSNINAINKCKISFNKSKYQYHNEMVFNNELVNPIAFYGTNGSGKSSILNAVAQMVCLLIDEPNKLMPFIPNIANVFEQKNSSRKFKNSYITVSFKLNNKNYSYKIETSTKGMIAHEQLTVEHEIIFDRSLSKYKFLNEQYIVESPMFPTLRTLSLDKNDETIKEAFQFLSQICFIDSPRKYFLQKTYKQTSYMDNIVKYTKEIESILSKYKEFPLYNVFSEPDNVGKKNYYAIIKHDKGELCLPWELMSSGMENQSLLLSTVLSLPKNGVMLIDEIEDALHPLTILDFINVVREKNIQLIFSSHNTFILQKLRPDQIYFANWKNGYSNYKKLSDIYPNIREINNIEKMYLSNLFDEGIKKDE